MKHTRITNTPKKNTCINQKKDGEQKNNIWGMTQDGYATRRERYTEKEKIEKHKQRPHTTFRYYCKVGMVPSPSLSPALTSPPLAISV